MTQDDVVQRFWISKDDVTNIPPNRWRSFRKTIPTKMVKMEGPFTVETREGWLTRQDGWLAIDADGYPYPIDPVIHALSYEEIDD